MEQISKRQQLRQLVERYPHYTITQLAIMLGQSETTIRGALSALGMSNRHNRRDSANYRLLERIRDMILENPDWPNKRLAAEAGTVERKVWEARTRYNRPSRKRQQPPAPKPQPIVSYTVASVCQPTRQTGYLKLL